MYNDVKIQISNGYLDIEKEEVISLNILLSDIKNPDKKRGSFSKTITLPGTKNNNYLLGDIYDSNDDFEYFNPNLKTNCKLLVNSVAVMDGYFKIDDIVYDKDNDLQGNTIRYNITIFEEVVDLFASIGDKKLEDLDFSAYNHTLNYTNISNSWSHTYKDVYTYPMLYKHNSLTWKTDNWTPAIYHKAYLKKIATDAGFSLGGSFMSDSTDTGAIYNKEIIPYNGDIPKLGEAERERRKFRSGLSVATQSFYGYTHSSNQNFGNLSTGMDKQLIMDDDSTSPNFDNGGVWDVSLGRWQADKNGKYDLSADLKVRVTFNSNGTTAWFNWANPFSTSQFSFNNGGHLNNNNPNSTINPNVKFRAELYVKKNGTTIIGSNLVTSNVTLPGNFAYPSTNVTGQSLSAALNSSNGYSQYKDIGLSGNLFTAEQVNVNDTFDFYVKIVSTEPQSGGSFFFQTNYYGTPNIAPVTVSVDLLKTFSSVTDSNIQNNALLGALSDGDDISLNDYVPKDFKQKDLFVDVINRYNLFISKDPDSNRILLDSRDDFYDSGEIKDYTDKKDYNKRDSSKLLAELQNKEYDFNYTKDEDYYNKGYQEEFGETFGRKLVEFTNNFTKGRKDITTPLSPTPTADNLQGLILPTINAPNISASPTVAPRCKPRVLYFDGLKNTYNGVTWTFQYIDSSGNNQTATYTTYPQALHTDDPIAPNIDLNFGRARAEYYTQTYTQTNNNLYTRYWSRTIELLDKSKMFTMYFNLNENDIYYLKRNMNVTLWIKDGYYYINKISNYNPNKNVPTEIELIKKIEGTAIYKRHNFVRPIKATGELTSDANAGGGTDYGGSTQDNNDMSSSSRTQGSGNTIPGSARDVLTIGDNNTYDNGVENSGVLGGSNNRIGGSNSWIISSDNRTITRDNEIWIGDVHIVDGQVQPRINLIDGGEDELRANFSPRILNLIDGGEDELTDKFPDNPINLIDGGVV